MEAHQYKIKISKSKTESINFNLDDITLKNSIIKPINKEVASKIILEYEWLKSMPYIVKYCFGIYFKINGEEKIGGVLVFSNDYADNTGVWDKYGFTNKLLLLSRGVCLWWTPKNTASYFISKACHWIKINTKYRIITATVDPAAGEIGTIYQALGWHYIGVMSGNYYHNKESKRFSVYINGKLRGSRWIRNELGTMKKDEIMKFYPDAKIVYQYRKRRYFYFMDDKVENVKHVNSIKHFILPYPKRNVRTVGIIYLIINKINNKKYVGQTVRAFNDRIIDYKRGLGNNYLNNAFNKYGWDNFEFIIIDTAETLDELNIKEIRYIQEYKSNIREFGYNLESGGKNSIPNMETLERMSKSHLGIRQNDNWINKRIAIAGTSDAKKYGKRKTDEDKLELSIKNPRYWQGKSRDNETRKKISQTKLINGLSDKQKQAICKQVKCIDINTNIIVRTFESTAYASKFESVNQSTISRWCANNKIINNIKWSY
jgi:group I intron endonuclease